MAIVQVAHGQCCEGNNHYHFAMSIKIGKRLLVMTV